LTVNTETKCDFHSDLPFENTTEEETSNEDAAGGEDDPQFVEALRKQVHIHV
jgi:hypothetical protein